MGYASYKEAIEFALEDLAHLRGRLGSEGPDLADLRARAESLGNLCDRVSTRLLELLDLATDPSLAMADEIVQLRKQLGDAKSQMGSTKAIHQAELLMIQTSVDALKRDLDVRNSSISALEAELAGVKKTLSEERGIREDFGSAIARYPPNDRRR